VSRWPVVVLLALALLCPALTTLAYIDPPDPPWISGFWDDDDFDSAVDAVLQSCAVEPESPDAADVRWTVIARVAPSPLDVTATPRATATSPRGPPLAS
jgi:hypothetical protein